MADRAAFIAQKRATLKGQITSLTAAVSQNKVDTVAAKLRLSRVTTLFHAYEELNDELALLDPQNEGLQQIEDIRDRYYEIAARVEGMSSPSNSSQRSSEVGLPIGASTFLEKQKMLKLPVADVPKFNGDWDTWLSFRNSFQTMIDNRADIDDLVKFCYLKNALTGDALNKIAIYDASAESYKDAWNALLAAYDHKRILITKHLDALIDTTPLIETSASGLSRMVDETRQHLGMLKLLEVQIDDRIVVRFLERALPTEVRKRWEESLTLDESPSLDKLYRFINTTAFTLSTMEVESRRVGSDRGASKRPADKDVSAVKRQKSGSGARAFFTTPSAGCENCRGAHRVYSCPEYNAANVTGRWEIVTRKKLCPNCLRVHQEECKSIKCKKCKGFHHTSLHSDAANANPLKAAGESNPPAASQ